MIERHVPAITEIRTESDPEKATALINEFKPQLVFLDVVMPRMTGFDFLNTFQKIPFHIIFTTAYDEYAIRAIRYSAVDYLLKPIDADELKMAVQRFQDRQNDFIQNAAILENLSHNMQIRANRELRLTVPTATGALFFNTEEIIRLEGLGNYTTIFLTNSRKHVSAKTLKEYEDLLPPEQFIRIHKSYMVNRSHIVNYLKEGEIILTDSSKLPVSRRKKAEVTSSLIKSK